MPYLIGMPSTLLPKPVKNPLEVKMPKINKKINRQLQGQISDGEEIYRNIFEQSPEPNLFPPRRRCG